MSVSLVDLNNDGFTLKLSFRFSKSMLKGEQDILDVINTAGAKATGLLLKNFDTEGSTIKLGDQTFTTKGLHGKDYQTPYGTERVERHVYQSHSGGKTYCPLDDNARIVITSTPKFAQMISSKYSNLGVTDVKVDLEENHGRIVQKKLIQDVSMMIGTIAIAKEESWNYEMPKFDTAVEGISIGLDGTCMLMKDEGWREAMVGTISFYDKYGEKIHTTYAAAAPEYGKEKFLANFESEIGKTKEKYPNVYSIGLADGAIGNWPFLEKHTDHQLLDFYHASEYIGSVGQVIYKDAQEREAWVEENCHRLKHTMGGASRLLTDLRLIKDESKKKEIQDVTKKTITYFENNNSEDRMQYYKFKDTVLPIGSGATEAACKVIVKERMCQSGMRWKNDGAKIVLSIRCLHQTNGRWGQFWSKIDQYGLGVAA